MLSSSSAHWPPVRRARDRKSTRLNSSHSQISYAGFWLEKNAEEAVGDRLLEPRRRIGTQGALEQGLAIVVECREPLGSGEVSHGGPLRRLEPPTRRRTV